MLREYRIELAHVDRSIERTRKLVVPSDPAEDARHLAIRVLAWCLLYEDEMTFGGGQFSREAPDLEARDADGRLRVWVDCGATRLDPLLKVLQHNRDAQAHVVFADEAPRAELLGEIERLRQRPASLDRVTLWMLDAAMVQQVAAWQEHRQRWSVTVVGEHLYVTAGSASADGDVRIERLVAAGR